MGTTVGGLLQVLAYPLTSIFSSGHSVVWYYTYVVIVQSIAIVWVLLQKNSICGGDFMKFVATLPISEMTRIGVNLTLLLIANSILLVVLISAVLISAAPDYSGNSNEVYAIVALLVLTLIAQLATLEKPLTILPAILFADWLLALSLTIGNGLTSWLLIVCAIAVALLGVRAPNLPRRIISLSKRPIGLFSKWYISGIFPPVTRIQLKALASRPGHTTLLIGSALGIAIATIFLINIFEFDNRTLPTLALAMATIAFVLSSAYRTFFRAHAQMQCYSAALPLGRHFWAVRDTAFVIVLGILYLSILFPPIISHAHVPISKMLFLCLAYGVLLAVLRLSLLFGGRQTVLLSFALTACWAGAVIAIIL